MVTVAIAPPNVALMLWVELRSRLVPATTKGLERVVIPVTSGRDELILSWHFEVTMLLQVELEVEPILTPTLFVTVLIGIVVQSTVSDLTILRLVQILVAEMIRLKSTVFTPIPATLATI